MRLPTKSTNVVLAVCVAQAPNAADSQRPIDEQASDQKITECGWKPFPEPFVGRMAKRDEAIRKIVLESLARSEVLPY